MTTESIWGQFSQHVENFIRQRVDDVDDVKDILQEVFVKIHLNSGQLKEEHKLQQWIFQITRNTISDYYRAKRHTGNEEVPELEDTEVGFYGAQDMFCCLEPFVKELPEHYRIPVQLVEIEGKKQKDVAKQLNMSYSALKSRIQRAREMLKHRFVECCKYELGEDGLLHGEQDCQRCSH